MGSWAKGLSFVNRTRVNNCTNLCDRTYLIIFWMNKSKSNFSIAFTNECKRFNRGGHECREMTFK